MEEGKKGLDTITDSDSVGCSKKLELSCSSSVGTLKADGNLIESLGVLEMYSGTVEGEEDSVISYCVVYSSKRDDESTAAGAVDVIKADSWEDKDAEVSYVVDKDSDKMPGVIKDVPSAELVIDGGYGKMEEYVGW